MKYTHTEITKKLIGNVQPSGMHSLDQERLENLKEMCNLVNELVTEIDNVHYNNRESKEKSVKEMADYADNFLTNTLGIKP